MNLYRPEPESEGSQATLPARPAASHGRLGRRRMTLSLTAPGAGPNRPKISRWIPVPDIPIYPTLSGKSLRPGRRQAYPNVLDVGPAVFPRLGRYAIALAFQCVNLRPGDHVLVPAYHCDSMIVPVLGFSAQPVFYRIKENLRVDLDDLASKIDGETRAVIATHYFGFHQDIVPLRELCDRHNLVLIEDCAHAFYGTIQGRPLGSFGDYAVASLWKFFPVLEGGCLVSAKQSLDGISLRSGETSANFRAFVTTLDQARYYGRLWPLQPLHAILEAANWARKSLPGRPSEGATSSDAPREAEAEHSGRSSHFNARLTDSPMLGSCRNLFSVVSRPGQYVAERRRRNYGFLLEHLQKISGCRPVVAELPDDVVPYMFPLRIDDLPRVFPLLEDAAMPMQRFGQFLWPGVDERTCPVSARYSHEMIQIPCHQELTQDDLEWMVETIRRICSARS